MAEHITPDEAIAECLKVGAQGISLGLAKQLQAERDVLKAKLNAKKKNNNLAKEVARNLLVQDELSKIKKWAQAQHDADGETIKVLQVKIDEQIKISATWEMRAMKFQKALDAERSRRRKK